jgi:hypothetical protein
LLVPVFYMFLNRKKFGPFFRNPFLEWGALAGFLLIILGITAYSYMNLPVFDFRPYKTGTNIVENMSIPEDAPGDEYEITLYYRKDGETRSFSVDSLPDSGWEWVRTESTLISKGYEPAISNFYIESVEDGTDYTYDILSDQGYTFMLVAWNLEKSSDKNFTRINRLADWSRHYGVNFICLTGSPEPAIRNFAEKTSADYDFYYSDEITLKTIIRSNPGLVLLKEGTILGKWHYRNIPDANELKEDLLSWSLENREGTKRNIISTGYLMALLLLVSLLKLLRSKQRTPEKAKRTDLPAGKLFSHKGEKRKKNVI